MAKGVGQMAFEIALFTATQVVLFYGVRWAMANLDPEKRSSKAKSKAILKRLGIRDLNLNEYEEVIAQEMINPEDIDVCFADIGGLDDVIESLKETVLYPLLHPEIYRSISPLLSPPKGVLLYGTPGCGKTMLAKALAKESGASFINLPISTLTNKWFGESQKLVKALFSLALKIQPTIVFLDEIDALFRERQTQDHEAMTMMKSEFMSLWDGLATSGFTQIVILGATNRPNDIDSAILRRMPKKFGITISQTSQRERILRMLLKDITLDTKLSIEKLVKYTEGYSGSDLKELCREAAMAPVREAIKALSVDNKVDIDVTSVRVRPIKMSDFTTSEMKRSQDRIQIPSLD